MGSSSDEVLEHDDKQRARFRSNMLLIKPNRSASKGCLIPFLYKVGRRLYILVGLSFKVYFHAVLLEKTHANLVLVLWSPFAVVDAFYSSFGVLVLVLSLLCYWNLRFFSLNSGIPILLGGIGLWLAFLPFDLLWLVISIICNCSISILCSPFLFHLVLLSALKHHCISLGF